MQELDPQNYDFNEIQQRAAQMRAQAIRAGFAWMADQVRNATAAAFSAIVRPARAK